MRIGLRKLTSSQATRWQRGQHFVRPLLCALLFVGTPLVGCEAVASELEVGEAAVAKAFAEFQELPHPINAPGSDGVSGDRFGHQIAVDGDTAAVLAAGDRSVYLFERTGATWTLTQKVRPTNLNAAARSIALSADTLVIGLDHFDSADFPIPAEVFARSGGVWASQQQLAPGTSCVGPCGRVVVAVSGNQVAVGLPEENLVSPSGNADGMVYVFSRTGSTWQLTSQVVGFVGQGAFAHEFGSAIAFHNDTLAISSPLEPVPGVQNRTGKVRLFARSGNDWILDHSLTASDRALIGATSGGVLTIEAGDTPAGVLQFSPDPDLTLPEDAGDAIFRVSRVGGATGTVSVTATLSGTAGSGDYTPSPLLLEWPAGDIADKTITLSLNNDASIEDAEVVTLTLGTPTGGAVVGSRAAARMVIEDNDAPAGYLEFVTAQGSQVVEEGSGDTTLVVRRSGGTTGAISAQVLMSGVATLGGDYTTSNATLEWADGDGADKTFTVSLNDDPTLENVEAATFTLSFPAGGARRGSNYQSTLLIQTSDSSAGWIEFSPAPADQLVGEDVGQAAFTVKRVGGSVGPIATTISLGGTGAYGDSADYVMAGRTLAWADGDASDRTISVTVNDDGVAEGAERVTLAFAAPAAMPQFGSALALGTGRLVVGATSWNCSSSCDRGSAYLFEYDGASDKWTQIADFGSSDFFPGTPVPVLDPPGVLSNASSFGRTVALQGDVVAVGAPYWHTGAQYQGAVFLFRRAATGIWSFDGRLSEVSDPTVADQFGFNVAIAQDKVFVGIPSSDLAPDPEHRTQGSVATYVRSGGAWSMESTLDAGPGSLGDLFGFAVGVSGDTAIVGSPKEDGAAGVDQGAAYVFQRTAGIWTLHQRLEASDAMSLAEFGSAVSIHGDSLVVGAPKSYVGLSSRGAAYVFTRNGVDWVEQQAIYATNGQGGDAFGSAVAIQGDAMLIGAPSADAPNALNTGATYVMDRLGPSWVESAILTAPNAQADDFFGTSVALASDRAVIGRTGADTAGVNKGSIHVFSRSGAIWVEDAQLLQPANQANDAGPCGRYLAVSGDTVATTCGNGVIGGTYARIFVKDPAGIWKQQQRLDMALVDAYYNFPGQIALHDDRLVVEIGYSTGIVHSPRLAFFTRSMEQWTLEEHRPFDGRTSRMSIATDGESLIKGTPAAPEPLFGNPNSGRVQVFGDTIPVDAPVFGNGFE